MCIQFIYAKIIIKSLKLDSASINSLNLTKIRYRININM